MKTLSPLLILFILFILSSCDPHVYFDMRDNNSYKWEKIGEQFWLERNMNYLPNVSPNTDVSLTDTVYYVAGYNGTGTDVAKTTENYKTYGVLYNWLAAQSACPEGWHLPSNDEWTLLGQFVCDHLYIHSDDECEWIVDQYVGKHLKSTSDDWIIGAPHGGDYYNFSGLPGGVSYNQGGGNNGFAIIGYTANWWSATEGNINSAWCRYISNSASSLQRGDKSKNYGYSVRCIKD